ALSVQYHKVKDETICLLSGQMIYRVWEGDIPKEVPLAIGEAFRVTPGTIHQMEAVTDCDILEVSTPHLDDVVRLSDRYGRDGTAGAVNLARPYVDQPVFIIFVDTIFDADLSVVKRSDADGIIWVKTVDDYQRFGVVVSDANGHMTKIVEKPSTPVSKRANIG